MSSTVSVIIPTYNSSVSLERSVKSALEQSLVPLEIIVVNDGSTDDTVDIVKKFWNKIIYIEQTNQGQGAARNAGLKVASGEYVAFLDSDDYWQPDFLKITSNFFESHPEAVAVNTGHIIKRFGKEIYGPALNELDKLKYNGGAIVNDFFKFWAKYDHVRTGTVLIRKNVIDKAGFQRADLRISQDLEYWGYIATFGKWGFIPTACWVGDPIRVVKKIGWNKKYQIRRRLCPTVENWERRILKRVDKNEITDFNKVRGRVAIGYAHNKILNNDWKEAYELFLKYSVDMPKSNVFYLMKLCSKFGKPGWYIGCIIFKIRELIKG